MLRIFSTSIVFLAFSHSICHAYGAFAICATAISTSYGYSANEPSYTAAENRAVDMARSRAAPDAQRSNSSISCNNFTFRDKCLAAVVAQENATPPFRFTQWYGSSTTRESALADAMALCRQQSSFPCGQIISLCDQTIDVAASQPIPQTPVQPSRPLVTAQPPPAAPPQSTPAQPVILEVAGPAGPSFADELSSFTTGKPFSGENVSGEKFTNKLFPNGTLFQTNWQTRKDSTGRWYRSASDTFCIKWDDTPPTSCYRISRGPGAKWAIYSGQSVIAYWYEPRGEQTAHQISSEDGFTLFLRTYDYQTVIIVCATSALCIFAALQLIPFIRTGKHQHGRIPENLAMATVYTVVGAGLYLVSLYFVPITAQATYNTFIGLRTAAQVLLAIVVLIAVLFALPHRFWTALRPTSILNLLSLGAANSASNAGNPQQPVETSAANDAATGETGLPEMVTPKSEPSVMAPAQGMALKLKRSEKQSVLGAVIYVLDARMDVSNEVRAHIQKHRLGKRLVYESEARQKHRDRALGHGMESAGAVSGLGWKPTAEQVGKGVLKTAWKLGRAGVSAARASLALRITVSSLISGVHVECKTMEELLEAETAIREAAENVKAYVEVGKTFDGGEELVEL